MYTIKDDKIFINDADDFIPMHILECGQIFRYKKVGSGYIVFSKDHKAVIRKINAGYEVISDDARYFVDFFDLSTDYSLIKSTLSKEEILQKAIQYGKGIRILKNDLLETIISFIISANNNIPRIQKSIEYIASRLGEKINDYYAFPTIDRLASADIDFFKKAGTGYRAKYLVDTIAKIKNGDFDLNKLESLDTKNAKKYLLSLKGVGEKVADCILLFGIHRLDVFPVDTWINKIYNESFTSTPLTNRKQISQNLVNKYGDFSGYAQQYLFYYRRSFLH